MKIVIRTRYIHTFLVCFRSFLTFYSDKINDLIVQVQTDKYDQAFIDISKIYGFTIKIIKVNPFIENEWAKMLKESIQYDEVVSMDDDIIFFKSGFFNLIERLKTGNPQIIGSKYISNLKEEILHSHLFYVNNVFSSEKDFLTKKDVIRYDGIDTALFGINNTDKILYIDNIINNRINNKNKSFYFNDYYVHVGGVSCLWHELRQGKE